MQNGTVLEINLYTVKSPELGYDHFDDTDLSVGIGIIYQLAWNAGIRWPANYA